MEKRSGHILNQVIMVNIITNKTYLHHVLFLYLTHHICDIFAKNA